MTLVKTALGLAAAVLFMAGCTFTPVQPGMSRDEVMASYGKPTRGVSMGSGTRLQYSRQPAGQSVVMVDLDAARKVVAVREVMTPQEFSKIEPGQWTREDVEREFGPPAWVDGVGRWRGLLVRRHHELPLAGQAAGHALLDLSGCRQPGSAHRPGHGDSD